MCERINIDFPCHNAVDYVFLLAQLNPSSFSVYAIPIDLCEHKFSKHVKTECHHQQISSHATILTLQTKSDGFSSRKISLLKRQSFRNLQHFFSRWWFLYNSPEWRKEDNRRPLDSARRHTSDMQKHPDLWGRTVPDIIDPENSIPKFGIIKDRVQDVKSRLQPRFDWRFLRLIWSHQNNSFNERNPRKEVCVSDWPCSQREKNGYVARISWKNYKLQFFLFVPSLYSILPKNVPPLDTRLS